MTANVLVIGGNIAGVQATLDIASSGIKVTLIESSSSLQIEGEEAVFLRPRLLEAASHPNIKILADADVTAISGKKGLFSAKVTQRPRYVNPQICTSCGRCESVCPVTIFDTAAGVVRQAIHRPDDGSKSVPSTCVVDKNGVAPCVAACPAGTNVQGYVALISKGKFREALDLVREALPFPHILGRVCTHPCESACTRGKVDQPIAVASLKRFLADSEASAYGLGYSDDVTVTGPSRVAIVGSGPAGLTCARDLARMGYKSTVFEALPVPGGMVAVGMPRFRLPREVREVEIMAIHKMGVEIRMNTPIGKDLTLDDLRDQGFEAVFVAIGAHRNRMLGISGEDLEGVLDAVTLLREVNLVRDFGLDQLSKVGENVVIIGGGYTAIDSARTAIRMGCDSVTIIYRRTDKEMTATQAEILEASEEGVDIQYLVAPVRIIGKAGKVVGIECQRMRLGKSDQSGRARPIPIEGSEFIVDADTIIPAIGQYPDLELLNTEGMGLGNNNKTITADPLTLATNLQGVFAGGDAVYGPRSMVEAVGDGRRAAVSIDRYLTGEDLSIGRTLERPVPVEVKLDEVKVPPGQRRRIPVLPLKQRVLNFEEVETGYNTFMALREAKRCLACGGCSECMECVRTCELEAICHDMEPLDIILQAEAVVCAADSKVKLPEGTYVIDENSWDSRLNASAVASRVLVELAEHHQAKEPDVMLPAPIEAANRKIGVFLCKCGGNISDIVDIPELMVNFAEHQDTVFTTQIGYACSDEGALEIRNSARMHGVTHVVLAACSCCNLDQICFSCSDRRVECKNKLLPHGYDDGLSYEFVNIREHCSWVHAKEPEKALLKARALISSAVVRARESSTTERGFYPIQRGVFVVGGGLAVMQAAANLGVQGFAATVLRIGEKPDGEAVNQILHCWLENGVRALDGIQLEDIQGNAGNFIATVNQGSQPLPFNVGAIIVDLSVVSNMQMPQILEQALKGSHNNISSRMPGVFLCKAGSNIEENLFLGDAVAGRVSAFLNQGYVQPVQTIAEVMTAACRGCGTCVTVCEFGAASLLEQSPGVFVSEIDKVICRGCGTCVARCPSDAIIQNGLSDNLIAASLEAMLAG